MTHSFKAIGTEAGLDFDVAFDPERRFHCLVGVNGVGKTHLIEHLARTLLYLHSMLNPTADAGRFSGLVGRTAIREAFKALSLRLATDITLDDARIKDRQKDLGNVVQLEQFRPEMQPSRPRMRFDRPVVFVGARERGHTPNVKKAQLQILGNREDRFINAFLKTWRAATGQRVPAEEPADWFASRMLLNPAFVVGNDNDYIAVVTVLELLQQLDPTAFRLVARDDEAGTKTLALAYRDGSLYFAGRPIDKLATGYVAVLKIFQEIVAGYSGWAAMLPDMPADKLGELDGIVFIDELEAHLHPQWQAKIVGILKRAFPNTTFFVTTHSPLVVRQTEPGEAVEILREGDKVTSRTLGSPRDWYLADVYSEGFHVELPLPGQDAPEDARPLSDVMLDFSNAVREHAVRKDTSARDEALRLHEEIDERLSPEDPRRRSLKMLRELLG